MKISELIKRLTKEKEINGDIEVIVEVEYACEDYGDHNCKSGADIDDIFTAETNSKLVVNDEKKLHLVLAGRE